jgi:hypothetical protein
MELELPVAFFLKMKMALTSFKKILEKNRHIDNYKIYHYVKNKS